MSRNGPSPDLFEVALEIAAHLHGGGTLTTAWVQRRYGVSRATAKRYVVRAECAMELVGGRELGSDRRVRKALRLAVPPP